MGKTIGSKSRSELDADELRYMRILSEPNQPLEAIEGLVSSYAGMMNSIQKTHVQRINNLMHKLFQSESDVTEDMRVRLVEFCAKKSDHDRFLVAYVQIASFHAMARYIDKLRSGGVRSTKNQHVFMMNYYAANWWMNLFLELVRTYPKHLELFNALGEIRH
jgi:hypothetical protein